MRETISIEIPDNWTQEREYAVFVIFHDFFDLSYSITKSDRTDYTISFGNKKITIKDDFWGKIKDNYIRVDYLPKIKLSTNRYCVESDIPILYGSEDVVSTANEINCGIDIFASVFFMLSRWEELANNERDRQNRFSAFSSVAYKSNILDRPIVNEYVEMLWNMLKDLCYNGERKQIPFEIVPTHDIDHIQLKFHFLISVKKGLRMIFKSHNLTKGLKKIFKSIAYSPSRDLKFLLKCSDELGLRSRFYFMSSETTVTYNPKNYLSNSLFKKFIKHLSNSNHIVGFHPGYATSCNRHFWEEELDRLRKAVPCEITEGRQHVLMWTNPETMRIWEANGMAIDSTLGYADSPGFRCGTGNLFHLFDVIEHKMMMLQERPLIIMDATLSNYMHLSDAEIKNTFKYYFAVGKKYSMPISILMHNTTFATCIENNWKKIYAESLSCQ
ncbi:hypothetical protein I6E23_10300 [Prevotella brevis]|nr:hypothetical protein [Xylanibacter brevis]